MAEPPIENKIRLTRWFLIWTCLIGAVGSYFFWKQTPQGAPQLPPTSQPQLPQQAQLPPPPQQPSERLPDRVPEQPSERVPERDTQEDRQDRQP